jgi:hypothetical protein
VSVIHSRRVPTSASICQIRSRANRFRSIRSPKETINFQAALVAFPNLEPRCDVDRLFSGIESDCPRITLMRNAFAGDVTSMGSPLTPRWIFRVSNLYSASLEVRSESFQAIADLGWSSGRSALWFYRPKPMLCARSAQPASVAAVETGTPHRAPRFTSSCNADCASPTIAWLALLSNRT